MKRLVDIVGSIVLLAFLFPIIFIVATIIWIDLGRPILFKQKRPGYEGKPFNLYKFRTMDMKTNENGELLPDRDRLTNMGLKIRNLSLDELPQLVNVLKGEMSLVGPRPLLMEYLPLYTKEQAQRHQVRPGITGLAQINGRNAITWEEKFKLDTWYAQNRNILLDLKIIFITLLKVIRKEGIHDEGHVSKEKFKGNEEVI